MTGYVDLREAIIWLQVQKTSTGSVIVWPEKIPSQKIVFSGQADANGNVHLYATDLEPGTSYCYQPFAGSDSTGIAKESAVYHFTTQALWRWRTDPPNFKIAFGSCAYINEEQYDRPKPAYGADYQIFQSIADKKPDLMIWLGDNIYLREVDFGSRSGIIHRYNHTRNTAELQPLLTACPNIAIWDDHDFGPNDATRSYIHKDWTLDAFKSYWANASYGVPDSRAANGVTGMIAFQDVDIFMLDNRSFRVAPGVPHDHATILGEDQIKWLIESLQYSKAPFKLVCVGGQFLNTFPEFETFSTVPDERKRIIDAIENLKIKGVVFLSGDRHCGEMSELNLTDGIKIYDITSSPLTSGPYDVSKENNTLRVPGTICPKRNFCMLEFSGKQKERIMTIRMFDSNGAEQWEKSIQSF